MVTACNFCGALNIYQWSRNVDVGIIAYVITHKASRVNSLATPTCCVTSKRKICTRWTFLNRWWKRVQVFRRESRHTEETYKRGKESSSYVNNVEYKSPTFIKSKLQLQNEDGARNVIMERNAYDISKLGEHNTFYQYQLCTPRSSTVTCVYRSHSILIRENPRNSPPCWR